MQPYSQVDSGLPLGWGYRSAPEAERSAGVELIGPVVVDPLLIIIFLLFTDECYRSFRLLLTLELLR